jgi:carbon-monoxide dehydrogenase catalytic subunit
MSEKAISIGCYFAGSGVYTIMGGRSPIAGSKKVTEFLGDVLEERLGGRLEFLPDPQEAVERALKHIDKKRAALGLPEYDAKRFGQSGDAVTLKMLEKTDDEILNVYSARA